ncbi:unnamed protein product [Durusdinium trenchii]|uniref:RNA ligase domain-containing protein n=1 Tax=Durusdinium trenchii TaxID=1381693 RepID=A0ABP0NJL4_9DINO
MELWRWVQANPLVHVVSRRLPTSPGFPQGLVLHDVALTRSRLKNRSEDTLFAEDASLRRCLRRGLSFLESGTGGISVVRRGLPKFFDLESGTLEARTTPGSTLLMESLRAAEGASSLAVTRLEKANGENAQVSYHADSAKWVLCSKNVSLLASTASELQLPQWQDRRYRFARQIGAVWFLQLSKLEDSSQLCLRETLSSATLIGEMVGGSGAHLVQYGPERQLRWFAMVPHEGDEACWSPSRSQAFFKAMGLPTVDFAASPPLRAAKGEALLAQLAPLAAAVEAAPVADAGEGAVIYVTATPKEAEEEKVIHLGKLKTAEYRLLRRMRDRAKQFARSAGCVLVEEVQEDFEREARYNAHVSEEVVKNHSLGLGKLCRLIFAEDLPPEEVDEHFLDLLSRARESDEGAAVPRGPRKPAPLLCVVAPPFQLKAETCQLLQIQLEKRELSHSGAAGVTEQSSQLTGQVSLPEALHRENLAAAWHSSTASHAKVYLNQIPAQLETLLFAPPSGGSAALKRRRADVERRASSDLRVADAVSQRCVFLFCGWDDVLATSLDASASAQLPGSPLERRLRKRRRVTDGAAARVFFGKLQAQAHRLKNMLPSSQTFWWPSTSVISTSHMSSVASAVEAAWGRLDAPRERAADAARRARTPTLVAVIPVALPGMGKSSLLEGIFQRCQASGVKCYRQGRPASTSSETSSVGPLPSSVALVSSDGFTGEELKSMGLTANECSSQDVARARKRASERYRVAVEEFVAAATAEGPHLLLLDKNHPPSGIRQEVEALQVTCQSFGCRLLPKVLAIEGADAPAMSEVEVELLGAEERHFGDWNYPWSLDVLAECAARLLKRPQHETLTGSETPLFVLLSFLQLHQRFNSANLKFPVLQVPYVSTCANLASFAGSTEEWMWCRLEVRALLRQTLDLMRKPFENQQQLRPLLQSLVTQLRAPGLRSVDPGVQRQHQERCLDALWPELLVEEEQSMTTPGFSAPALRYVALDVHAHHPLLESLLEKTSAALHAVADLRSDGDELSELFASFRRPAAQHVTTCYLGGAAEAAQWRKVVAESKALVLEGKAFDLRITHLVGAPGALAFAVVDRGQLVSDGLPMAEQQRPHITLCTRAPWQPRHSNELLEAVTPWLDDRTVQAAGKWVRNLKVNSAVLDVFILQLEHPVVLPSNPLRLC